jgi:deoxycytidine triphosphate deaminase
MIYSPKSILKKIRNGEIIKHLSQREVNNPEGVGFDLQIASLSEISSDCGSLKISTRRTPSHKSIEVNSDNCWLLEPGKTYLASTKEEFDLPIDLAAIFFPRSTLFRSGVAFYSSVLPPGYVGPMTFALINQHSQPFEIELGARFAHVVIHSVTGDIELYRGQWQGGRISQPDNEGQT